MVCSSFDACDEIATSEASATSAMVSRPTRAADKKRCRFMRKAQALSLQCLPKRTPVLVLNVSDAPSHFRSLQCEDDLLVDPHILKTGRYVPRAFFIKEHDQFEIRDFKILRTVEGVEVDLTHFAV